MKPAHKLLSCLAGVLLLAVVASAQGAKFTATLSGGDSVPAVTTPAHGMATFQLSANGHSLRYRLEVTDITDVTMAHIHLAAAGQNGPVVVWLYPQHPPAKLKAGKFSGVLASGTITAANLAGPLKGKTIADLIAKFKSGDAYVNVHTKAHPGGEIRGQIH